MGARDRNVSWGCFGALGQVAMIDRSMAWVRIVVGCCVLLAAWSVRAQTTFYWDGGHPSQDNWRSAQNWNPNGAPANNGTANLVFTGTIRLAPDANNGWNINSLVFDSAAGAFTIIGD